MIVFYLNCNVLNFVFAKCVLLYVPLCVIAVQNVITNTDKQQVITKNITIININCEIRYFIKVVIRASKLLQLASMVAILVAKVFFSCFKEMHAITQSVVWYKLT